ncbi:hypothetical protein B7494_g2172 [Chlorociboria aeruginascens]|nr:hypothetical protein B7494_g2172 [Chlorociboria aeruginascens]
MIHQILAEYHERGLGGLRIVPVPVRVREAYQAALVQSTGLSFTVFCLLGRDLDGREPYPGGPEHPVGLNPSDLSSVQASEPIEKVSTASRPLFGGRQDSHRRLTKPPSTLVARLLPLAGHDKTLELPPGQRLERAVEGSISLLIVASMPRRGKQSGPKRPREEGLPAHEERARGFSPTSYRPRTTSNDTNSTYPPPQTSFSSLGSRTMTGASSTTMSGPPPGKVAIPALRSSQAAESSQKVNKRGRTSHACDYCRKSKAGCSGEHPCTRCNNAGVLCVYGDGKRDKERKELSKLSKETSVLKRYQVEIRGAIQRMRIDATLSPDDMRASLDDILAMTPDGGDSRISSEPEDTEETGDYDADTEVGSTGSIDAINVDMDRDDTRATGHLGKSSSVSWAKRTAEECRQVNGQGFNLASYHTEDADIESFDSTSINAYELPAYGLADILVDSYFDHVHNAFPILDRASFVHKYKVCRTVRRVSSAAYQMPTGSAQPNIAYAFPVLDLPVTSSTYFIYRTQLSIISHEIVTHLYCATAIKLTWNDIQETIDRIDKRLTTWRDNLPKEFDIEFDISSEPDWNDPYLLPRTGLAMLFNSSRIVLFRPCLCRFEGRIARQSDKSKDFNQEAVQTCIGSARKMMSLLSWSATSVQKLYRILPWWNTLHYLCEALSVLMLEMAFQSQHLPDEATNILADAKKGINWLIMMSDQSISARKAWEIFDSLVRLVAPLIKHPVFDLPTQAPVPQGYNDSRFNSKLSSSPQLRRQGESSNEPGLRPLSVSNLQIYEDSQQNITHAAATMAWTNQGPQNLLDMNTNYTGPPFEHLAGNPLDYTTAVARFSTIGSVHGHYDDPWRHMFLTSPEGYAGPSGMTAGHFTEDQEMMGSQEQGYFNEQSGFDDEAFEGMGEENPGFSVGAEDQRTSQGAGRGRDAGSGGGGGGFGTGRERYFY